MAGKTTQDYLQAIYDSAAANDQYLDNVIAPDDGGTYDYFGDGGFLDSTINALSTGLGGAFEGAGTYLNQELGFGEGLANLGHDMQVGRQARTDWDMNKAMNDPLGFITDPSGLAYNTFNLIGSSVPDIAITMGASAATGGVGGLAVGAGLKAARAARLAKAASGLEKAMEVGSKAEGIGLRGAQLIKQYAPTVAGNIAGGAFDAATEAGSTYTEALENGATEDEARNAMQTDFIDNIGMSTIQNAIGMNMLKGAIKTPLGIGRKEIGEATEASGKGLLGAMSEAGGKVADFADNHFATRLMTRAVPGTAVEAYTEGLQNEFQDNAVHGYDVNYNPFDMSDESKNQMFMAAVGMLPQGILGSTRRRRVRAEENTADNNIDENTIAQPTDNTVQNENTEPEVAATPEENVSPEVIANPEENITIPVNEAIEGNTPVVTNEQVVPTTDENGTETPSFVTIYNSYINDRDPINNRTSEQLALDRSNEAEDMGYNTEEKKGQLRAVQDMADTIEALDTNEKSPLKQIGIKKPDVIKYIKNNFTNDVADTVAGGDKTVARDTLNQVADVLYHRNKKAEPERRRAANQAEAERLTKQGNMLGLGPVHQDDNGEYTTKSINGYKQKIANTKNRIDKEHNHFKLAKERQDRVPNETKFAESLSRAVDANDREQFVKDVNQSIGELSSYTTTPAKSLNRVTNYFHTKAQKDAVRKAFVGYYNDRVNGSKGFKFDINKHLKAANNIVDIKHKEELPAPKKLTIGQQRNRVIREARTSISNIRYKLPDMETPDLRKTGDKIEERIRQLEDRIEKTANKSEVNHLKQLQNVFLSGKKEVDAERKRRVKAIEKEEKQKEKLENKNKASKRKAAAKQKIDAFNKKMEDEKGEAQAKEEPTKDVAKEKGTTTEQKQKPAKKEAPPKKTIEVENASDEDINSVASRLWNYHRDHKQFNKQLRKRNGKYHIKDDKGNDYYYSEAVGDKIKSKYNELREAHFKEHPEDKAKVTKSTPIRSQSKKANSQQELKQATNNGKVSEEDKRKSEGSGVKTEGTEGGSKNGTVKGTVNSEGHEKGNESVQRAVPKGNDVGRSGSRNNGGRSTQRSSGLPVENAQSVQKYRETNPEVKQLYDNGNLKWDNDVKPEEVGSAIESMFYGYPESFKKTAIDLLNSMGIRIHITSKPIIVDTRGGKKNAGGLYKENTGEIIISRDKINDQIKSNSIKTRPTSAHENAHFIFSVLHKGPERDEAWRKFFNDIIGNDIKSAGVKNINELVAKESKFFTDEGIKEIEGFVSEILNGKPPSEKLQYRYYRTDDTGNGRIINAVLHRIALDDKHILKFVRDPNYFQELMVSKNTYERNRARNSLRVRCLTLINKHEGKGPKTTIKDLNKFSSNEMLEHARKSLGDEYAKYKAELEKIMEDGDWVTDTAMQSITKEHIEKYKNSILEKRSKAAKDKESSVENSFYDKSTESDTVTPEQRLEKAGYKSPIQHARDSLKTYGREFIDDVKSGKSKYSYTDRFWRTPEVILKDMIGGAASRIFDYAVKAQRIKNKTLQRYMTKYSHVYNGLKDNERRALNRAILYCDKNGRDPVQVMSAGKDRYIVYRDGDFIEAYNNINDAKNKLVELKRMDEYKNGEVRMSMVAGEDGLKALVYAVKDKNRLFSKKNSADAYAKKNYKQAVADMFDDVTTEELSDVQKAKLADKFTEYRKLMDEAYADMVSVASQYGVKIPPKKQGFFPRYHLPFVVMVKDKMGTKRVTSFYNQSEAQKMAKKLTAEGVKSYVIELSPIDQIRVGINQHDREYLTDDEIKEIEEGKTMSFADMNESLEEHGEGMKLLTNLLNKRFKDGATTVPAKVILKDLSKKVQDNGRTKKQIRATGIIKEMSKYKGSELTKEDVAKILDKCNRHGVFNAHLMHRTDASGYSFNVQNSVYRYLTDVAAYAGNEMFSQEAKKAYAQRFKRDFTLPAMNKEQAYCQEYINAVLSKRNITWLDNMLNSVLKSIPGFGAWIRKWSPNPYTDVAGKILGAQNVLKLGMFNVSSGAVQLSQLLNANAKLGGNKFIGMSKAFRFGLREAFKNKGLYNDKELNKKYGEIFDYIGLYDSIPSLDREMTGKPSWFMDKNRKILGGKSLGDIAEASMYFFNRGDIKARQATAIGAMYKFEHEMKKDKIKEYLKKGKKFDEAEKLVHNDMLKYVDRVVRETNFDYSVVNTPLGLSGLGVTGKLIMQFKKYPFFTLNFLRGNTKEENIRFLVPIMLMGGIFGLPCLDLFDDTVATVTGADPKLSAKKAIMEWAGNSPQKRAFANVAMYGAPSLAGIDISGRIGLNDAASLDAGPTYSTAKKLLSSAKKGDFMGMAEALTSRATVAKSLARGGYADSHGNLVTQYDTYDKMLKVLGFRPVEESHGADLNRVISQSKNIMQEHTNKAIEEYKKHPTIDNYQALRVYGLSDNRIASLEDEQPNKNSKSSVYKSNHSKEANDIRRLESFK